MIGSAILVIVFRRLEREVCKFRRSSDPLVDQKRKCAHITITIMSLILSMVLILILTFTW